MITLIFAVCMVDEPTRCKDVSLVFEGEKVSTAQCFTYGQMEMAKWLGDHPNWIISKWRCVDGQVAKL
jgi:hypothetical protein